MGVQTGSVGDLLNNSIVRHGLSLSPIRYVPMESWTSCRESTLMSAFPAVVVAAILDAKVRVVPGVSVVAIFLYTLVAVVGAVDDYRHGGDVCRSSIIAIAKMNALVTFRKSTRGRWASRSSRKQGHTGKEDGKEHDSQSCPIAKQDMRRASCEAAYVLLRGDGKPSLIHCP